jgi:hypothetical protein
MTWNDQDRFFLKPNFNFSLTIIPKIFKELITKNLSFSMSSYIFPNQQLVI